VERFRANARSERRMSASSCCSTMGSAWLAGSRTPAVVTATTLAGSPRSSASTLPRRRLQDRSVVEGRASCPLSRLRRRFVTHLVELDDGTVIAHGGGHSAVVLL